MSSTCLVLVAVALTVPPQNVRPQIGYIYPSGGRAGSVVEVQLGTYDWTPDAVVLPRDPRVKVELLGPAGPYQMTPPPFWFGLKAGQAQPPLAREVPARITLPADLPPGAVQLQVANANGGSEIFEFQVSTAAEALETEKAAPSVVQQLPSLPCVVSGRLSRITEVDRYAFKVSQPGLVRVRLDDRVGQAFGGQLTIRDAQGTVVADAADTVGRGLEVQFVAAANSSYTAEVQDVEFGGDRGYVYRLHLETGPQVISVLPLAVKPGESASLEFIGWGLKSNTAACESLTRQVTVPANVTGGAWQTSLETPHGTVPATVYLSEATDALLSAEAAMPAGNAAAGDVAAGWELSLPAVVSAALDRVPDGYHVPLHQYRFTAHKADVVRFEVQCEKFASPVDPVLAISAPDGKELTRLDDQPGAGRDLALEFKVPADGTYRLTLADVSGLPPSRAAVYRLSAQLATGLVDFSLQVPDRVEVPLDGAADLSVKIARRGVWKGAVSVRVEGLPECVTHAADAAIADNKPELKLTLAGAATGATDSCLVHVVGTLQVGEEKIERRAGPLLLTTTLKPRVVVKSAVQDGGRIVNRGTTYPADVIIERLEGYTGPVTLQMAATQQRQRRGIFAESLVVPAEQTQVQYPIFMPEWLETSLTARMNVIGIVEVPDPTGRMRYVTGNMDGLIVMSLEGGLLKLTHEPQERRVRPGQVVDVPIRLSRTARLPVRATVELVAEGALAEQITAEPIALEPNQSTAVIKLRFSPNLTVSGACQVTLRATALQDGRWPARSETVVPLIVELPGSVARQ